MKKWSIVWIATGCLLLAIGMAFLLILPVVIMRVIDSKLILEPDNPSWPLWRDLPIPILQKFYLFNVTNPREVQRSGARPDLQQVGPFVYRLDVKKRELNLSADGQSVLFNEHMTFHFDRQLSADDLSLKITTINAPLAIAMQLMADLKSNKMRILATILISLLNEDFFVTKSVEELLFEGYPDLLTKLAPMLSPKIPYQPSFGWMWGKNESDDGLFSVNTGKRDIQRVNEIELLNGRPDLSFWSSNRCNSLSGAKNGELFNPITSQDKSLLLFRTNFCRVLPLVWTSELKSRYGHLSVYRYYPADTAFANSTDYPPNSCYKPNENQSFTDLPDTLGIKTLVKRIQQFVNDSDVFDILEETYLNYQVNQSSFARPPEYDAAANGQEFPSGVFGLSVCYYGAPVFISNPHFFKSDPYYLSTVDGLKPDPQIHQSFIDVEPITGTPVELELRVQLNLYINKIVDIFPKYRKMPKIHVPVMWQEFTIHVTDELATDLHWKLTAPSTIATVVSSLFIVFGALTLLYIVSKPMINRCRHRHQSTGTYTVIDDSGVDNCDTDALVVSNDSNDSQPVIT